MSLANNTTELNAICPQVAVIKEEYGKQTNLISQIKAVLEQKASGEIPPSKLTSLLDGSITELTEQDLQGLTKIRWYGLYYLSQLKSVYLPNTVKSIETQAFMYCQYMETLVMPNSVTYIGGSAFQGCGALNVYYKGTLEQWVKINFHNNTASPTGYVENVYINNEPLINLTIPDTITEISDSAFSGCRTLTSLTIGSGLTKLSKWVFVNCTKLTSVNFSENSQLRTIEQEAFATCTKLSNITIPSSVTSIDAYALTIGSSSNKATIEFKGTTPPTITTSTFTANKLNQIIVPKGYGDTYKSATNWSNFADYIVEASE